MVINNNNSQINTFNKGMNSDIAFDQIENSQYVFGKNVRITRNQNIGDSSSPISTHEGIITPVPAGEYINDFDIEGDIIYTGSVDRMAIVITKGGTDMMIYRAYIKEDAKEEDSDRFKGPKLIYRLTNILTEGQKQISAVLYKELDNVIKLYIATGQHPIACFRVDKEYDNQHGTNVQIDDFINNRIIPTNRVRIEGVIQGRLLTQQVQYTYRLYNKYGNTTQLAPLTNKIQVIDPSRSKEIGNAENTETSIGFTLSIDLGDTKFERIQVYRLSYIKPNADADVSLIYDGKVKKETNTNKFVLNDVGIEPLQELTMEEFSAMSGLILVPQCIEQNQEYLFCANVKDDTILMGAGPNIVDPEQEIPTVTTDVVLSTTVDGQIPKLPTDTFAGLGTTIGDITVAEYFNQRGINPDGIVSSYNNMFTSSLLRSLRRGEEYKYAIVYYDKYGRRTDVKQIGIAKTESISDSKPFTIENGKLIAHPIGVKITIPQPVDKDGNLLENIIGCQIVRRSSSELYQKTLLQVALARPIRQGLLDVQYDDTDNITEESVKKSPYYPSGLLTVNDVRIYPHYYVKFLATSYALEPLISKTDTKQLYQIFSSEIDFRRDDVLSKLSFSDLKIEEQLYVPSVFSRYVNAQFENENVKLFSSNYYTAPQPDYDYNSNRFRTVANTFTIENLTDPKFVIQDVKNSNVFNFIHEAIQNDNLYRLFFNLDAVGGFTKYEKYAFGIPNGWPEQWHIYFKYAGQEDNVVLDVNVDEENLHENQEIIAFFNNLFSNPQNVPDLVVTTNIPEPYKLTIQAATPYQWGSVIQPIEQVVIRRDCIEKLKKEDKPGVHWVFNFFDSTRSNSAFGQNNVNSIKDVKIADHNSGFSNYVFDSDTKLKSAIKKYRSYTTNIDQFVFNNWVSFGKYDLKPGYDDAPNMDGYNAESQEFLMNYHDYKTWTSEEYSPNNIAGRDLTFAKEQVRNGYIGPGPSCFLLSLDKDVTGEFYSSGDIYTSICNITHTNQIQNVQSEEFEQYYGFGNYFSLELKDGEYKIKVSKRLANIGGIVFPDSEYTTYTKDVVVFDGDIYITPHEFTTLFKTYDFNSFDSLQSTQITNYVPLESKVNTYFDYGKNLLNTGSANLLYEPGSIDGVTTQDRPLHQYNMIYSDNDASNDVFTLITTDENETNNFKQRAYYSELKTNGEFIDNFMIFKPAAFIDVDSKYGEITNLMTDRNNLYYWQDTAFGKFSVNERSLVNDQNGNTIMLGQAGILSRYDYLSTKFGMRPEDFCAVSTENGVFWVDINNKAVVGYAGQQVFNFGEQLNVQNIINKNITLAIPKVDYDVQNNELLCKCLTDGEQLIFNLKYNIATSIYNRIYDDIIYIKNHMYGLDQTECSITKYNYLAGTQDSYLSPIELSFIVNPMASVVKVYDSQTLIPIKRDKYNYDDHNAPATVYDYINDNAKIYGRTSHILDNTTMHFETDIMEGNEPVEDHTDREGNIIYNVPRQVKIDNKYIGNRIRGKWMKVDITKKNPTDLFTISHVITKFRQSYS